MRVKNLQKRLKRNQKTQDKVQSYRQGECDLNFQFKTDESTSLACE